MVYRFLQNQFMEKLSPQSSVYYNLNANLYKFSDGKSCFNFYFISILGNFYRKYAMQKRTKTRCA